MAAPYLTSEAAIDRLDSRFEIEPGVLGTALLEIASDELDARAPFLGRRYASAQPRAFPRSKVPEGETPDGIVPDAVLDYVTLRAAQLSLEPEAPVQSEGAGGVSVSYAQPKLSRLDYLLRGVLKSLQRHRRRTVGIVSAPTERG